MKVVVMIMTVKYMFNIICNNIVFLNTLLKWWLIISCTFIYLLPWLFGWLFGYIANKNYLVFLNTLFKSWLIISDIFIYQLLWLFGLEVLGGLVVSKFGI